MALLALSASSCGSNDHNHDSDPHEGHKSESEEHKDSDHDHSVEAHSDADHGEETSHSDDEITLHSDRAKQLGVETEPVKIDYIYNVVKVSGEAAPDPRSMGVAAAPYAGNVTFTNALVEGKRIGKGAQLAVISTSGIAGADAIAAAKIDYENALREVNRLKPLLDEGLATRSEYNAALSAMEAAKNAAANTKRSITAPVAGTIKSVDAVNGQYVEAGTPIATIAGDGNIVVRADLPKRYINLISSINSATIKEPYTGDSFSASLISSPSESTATAGYIPVYFNIGRSAHLAPGSYVEVYISAGTNRRGISVPTEAITDKLGNKFVYVKLDDNCYERRPVSVGTINATSAEITDGLREGEQIVTKGVTFVRLAENSNVAVPGHTHNH